MTARRKKIATIEQHEETSRALLEARECVRRALSALGLTPDSPHEGQALARETDTLLRVQAMIDQARTVCESRLADDHPSTWTTDTYYPLTRLGLTSADCE